jgi:hypothetical protein
VIHLAAVAGSHEEEVEFCTWCGRLDGEGQRVCPDCGLGVMLHTDAGVLRSPGSTFLIARRDGMVSAMSAAAERMFGNVVGRPVATVLRSRELPPAVALAAAGRPAPVTLPIENMKVTVAPCGLPPAALVLIERV